MGVTTPSGPGAGRDPAAGPGEDLGGDAVCWLDRVCPSCGALRTADPPAPCPRCGDVAGPA